MSYKVGTQSSVLINKVSLFQNVTCTDGTRDAYAYEPNDVTCIYYALLTQRDRDSTYSHVIAVQRIVRRERNGKWNG